jgi:hypothetical protein
MAKIARHQRQIQDSGILGTVNYKFIMGVMTESGVLYAITGVLNIMLYARNSSPSVVETTVFQNLAVSAVLIYFSTITTD